MVRRLGTFSCMSSVTFIERLARIPHYSAGADSAEAAARESADVAMLASNESPFPPVEGVVEAVRSGARGYVLKARDAEHLIQTVRLVAGGNMVIDPQLVVALAEELSTANERDRRAETLTAREIEVLQLLAFGHTNRDIAERLYISPDTVKTHLEHIFEKLGASDRTAAVAEALRRRLIE